MSSVLNSPAPRRHGIAIGLVILCALGSLCAPARAEVAYRWKDANGRVHFADQPPPGVKAERIELQKTPSVQPVPVKPPAATGTLEPAPEDSGIIDTAGTPKPREQMSCEERWAQYFKSQECFAPYQRIGAGPREEAYEKCTEVPSPEAECGAAKNFPE